MKKFNAEMKVVRFGAEDVIVTSGKSLTLSNTGDGNRKNNSMEFDGVSYLRPNYTPNAIRVPLSDYFDSELSNMPTNKIMFYNGNDSATLTEVWNDYEDVSYDGKYTYAGEGRFNKQ